MARTAPLYTQHQALSKAATLAWEMNETAARVADLLELAGCELIDVQGAIATFDRALGDVHAVISKHRGILERAR
jgi:hypothetical protein